ncbi:MAG TPA: N-acetylmuramoyl-L-alanine amidase [Chloroflexia bacterium]|nr:N-acetylmuramoyl-L-alanine amidase [Chloroflexia bacterium]
MSNAATAPKYIDLRGRLPYHQGNAARWLRKRPLGQVTESFVHFPARAISPGASQADEIAQLTEFANFHIRKNWGQLGSIPAYGWTVQYHWAVGPSGRIYILNNPEDILWNTSNGNPVGVATLVMLGEGQQPTAAQLATLRQHLDYIATRTDLRLKRVRTWGHGECGGIWGGGPAYGNSTNCPGRPLLDWVRQYRKEAQMPEPVTATNRFFPETGHYISNAFKAKWEELERAGLALPLVGFPTSEEMEETLGGWTGTVQYFQRARMEWHTESGQGQVMFGLVADELRACRVGADRGCGCE